MLQHTSTCQPKSHQIGDVLHDQPCTASHCARQLLCVGKRKAMLTISGPELVARLAHEHASNNSSRCGNHTCNKTLTIQNCATCWLDGDDGNETTHR